MKILEKSQKIFSKRSGKSKEKFLSLTWGNPAIDKLVILAKSLLTKCKIVI